MSVNGSGVRALERGEGVPHTTVLPWVKQVGTVLPDRMLRSSRLGWANSMNETHWSALKQQNPAVDSGRPLQGGNFRVGDWRP